jgi:chaperonin GroES
LSSNKIPPPLYTFPSYTFTLYTKEKSFPGFRRIQFCTFEKKICMRLTSENRFKKLIVIGDRVLIRLAKPNEKTESGLYLPPGVQEKEKVQQGYVIKTGPGYAIPMPVDDEPWKADEEQVKYVPLQAREGDLAIFLLSGATEVIYEGEKYFIVPQSAILMLEREEEL